MALRVSELAQSAGVSADTIRYYERLGLLPEASRTDAGYRQFKEADARRLRFIKDAQRLGLSLTEIGELLNIQDNGACPCGHTKSLLERRLAQVNNEIALLVQLRDELGRLSALECFPSSGGSKWPCEIEFPKKGGEPMTPTECGCDCPCSGDCTCESCSC
jgi:DNA-binding transcriptional MerR regulator